MIHCFKPEGGDWLSISHSGTKLPGGGEFGEDVVVSHAFVESLDEESRAARGFIPAAETDQPEGETVTGWVIEDVDGVPTQVWTVASE